MHTFSGSVLILFGVLAPLAQAAEPDMLESVIAARIAREEALKVNQPRLTRKKDFLLYGETRELGPVSLNMRGALAYDDPERGNHYEFALQFPLLADEFDRLTLFFTSHYSDRTRMTDPRRGPQRYAPLTLMQTREFGFVTDPPKPGYSSLSAGATWRHKVTESVALDGTIGVFKLGRDNSIKPQAIRPVNPAETVQVNVPIKNKVAPRVSANAGFKF